MKKINNILIERYNIKYSTIVIYNGTEYVVRASNVEQKHWDTLRNLQNEEIFKDSIQTATPKYIYYRTRGEKDFHIKKWSLEELNRQCFSHFM